MAKLKVTPGLLRQLEKEGFVIKRKSKLVRRTMVVDEESLTEFMKVRAKLGLKVQDAMSEALSEWTQRNQKRIK